MSDSESGKAKSGEPEHPNRLTQKPSEKSPSTVMLPEKANVPMIPTSLMPSDEFMSNEEAAFEHSNHPKLPSSIKEEEKYSEDDDVIILESPTNTSLYIALEETSNVLVEESSLFWDDLNCTPQSSADYNCNLDAAGPSTCGHTGSQDLPNYSCPSSYKQTKAPASKRNSEVDQDVKELELTPLLYIDFEFEETRKNEEEWKVFVKNGNYSRQEYLSYVTQKYTLCETQPLIDRIEQIFSNLRELELERDALKEKVLSRHHLSIKRTYLINLHIQQLLLERKDLKDKVLKVQQQRLALRKSFMSRNSAPGPSQSTVEESARKLDDPHGEASVQHPEAYTEVMSLDPVLDVSTSRKRKLSGESKQKKTKGKGLKKTSANTDVSETTPTDPMPNIRAVRCVDNSGPCVFAGFEDGTISIYELSTHSLVKDIKVSTYPVTWLYIIALSKPRVDFNKPTVVLNKLKSIESLNHLMLITGSEDGGIRQNALNTGALIHEKFCICAPTCIEGTQEKLYVGTEEGDILAYIPQGGIIMQINNFKVNGRVLCMKIVPIRGRRAIVVAARHLDPVVFDLESENSLFKLVSNFPSSSFHSFSYSSNYVFGCDDNKNVCLFDINSGSLYKTETFPASAMSSSFDGNQFLILGYADGVIRVLDTLHHEPPYPVVTLQRQGSWTITCMKVFGSRILCGTLNGDVVYRRLHKASPIV